MKTSSPWCACVLNFLALILLGGSGLAIDEVQQHGNLVYLSDKDEAQIFRYDLGIEQFLPPISVVAGPFVVDDDGLYVAQAKRVYRYNINGTGRQTLANVDVASDIVELFTDGNLLFANSNSGLYSRFTSLNKATGATLDSKETYVDSLNGGSIAPGINRIFGRTTGVSPSDITAVSYDDAGVMTNAFDSPQHGGRPSASRAWVFPDEATVVDNGGSIYQSSSLLFVDSFDGSFDDIIFAGGVVPVLLDDTTVTAYSNTLLETGSLELSAAADHILHFGDKVFAFRDGTSTPLVEVLDDSPLQLADPTAPKSAVGLPFEPDEVLVTAGGAVYLMSKAHSSLFAWSLDEKRYVDAGTLALQGGVTHAVYSEDNDTIYTAYSNNDVRSIDLGFSSPEEGAFAVAPNTVRSLSVADDHVFVLHRSATSNSNSHAFYRPDGSLVRSVGNSNYSAEYIWNSATRTQFYLRDGSSPNDLHRTDLDAGWNFSNRQDSPYHGDYSFAHPIRVNEAGSRVAVSGNVFDGTTLSFVAALPFVFADATWLDDDSIVATREIGGLVQVQRFDGANLTPGPVAQFDGTPLRLAQVPSGELLLVMMFEEAPRFALLDPETLETTYITPTEPAAVASAHVEFRTDQSVTLGWDDLSDNEDGFRVEYRASGASGWLDGGQTAADESEHTVSGLTPATDYEFRVYAFNSGYDSAPSDVVEARTLSHPDAPIGEPYFLAATRIFSNSITLQWRDNSANETAFAVFRRDADDPFGGETRIDLPANTTVYADNGLSRNTNYSYRVQVSNGFGDGDLSGSVLVQTMSSNSVPATVQGFVSSELSATSVTISWDDNSTNENGFIIQRAASSNFSGAIEVGRVGFNVTQFTDAGVEPDERYYYRAIGYNAFGNGSASGNVLVQTPPLGGQFEEMAVDHDGIYYFGFSAPNRIERYDIGDRTWLAPLPLSATPTALWVDADGIFVGMDTALVSIDSSGIESAMLTAAAEIRGLAKVGDDLLAAALSSRVMLVLNKDDGILIGSESVSYSLAGISSAGLRVFGRTTGVSPADIYRIEFNADGTVAARGDSPHHGDYPSATATFTFPDGSRVFDTSGTVYNTSDLSYNGSLAGAGVTAVTFIGSDVPILLRANVVTAYNNTLLGTGSLELNGDAARIAVSGDDLLAFSIDGTDEHGLSVLAYDLDDLNPATPGEPKDPLGLPFTPDDLFVDRDNVVYLFSKAHASLFPWSPLERRFLTAIPLVGGPDFVTYSEVTHTAYTAYPNGEIKQIDLAGDRVEQPFVNSPQQPQGLATAGEFVFVVDPTGAWVSHFTYRPDGTLISEVEWNYFSREYIWNDAMRRMYFFRDDSSPNDILFENIAADGTIGTKDDSPYHGDYSFTHPIRVSDSGNRIVIGSGNIFSGTSLEWRASIPNAIDGAVWLSDTELISARTINGLAQIQEFTGTTFAPGIVRQFQGTVHSFVEIGDELLLVTMLEETPRFAILDKDTLEATYVSPSKPIAPSDLRVTSRAFDSIGLAWQDNSDNEESFRVEMREVGTDDWLEVEDGVTTNALTIFNLKSDTQYEIRVFALSGEFESDESNIATGRTLSHPNAPAGEPYNMVSTRVFADSVTLEWTDNANNEDGFYIYRSSTAGQPTSAAIRSTVPAGQTSFTATGLTANRTFYFRVQVFNDSGTGDLSNELAARTLSSNGQPAAANNFEIVDIQAGSVTVGWRDNSTNEDGFVISRSPTTTFSQRVEVGRVAFNVTNFTDTTVGAGQTYYYRVEPYNGAGTRPTSQEVRADTPTTGGEYANLAHLHDGIYYFAFDGPQRLERYDVAARSWLAPVPLSDVPVAMWVDDDGIFVGLGQQLVNVNAAGVETHVATASSQIAEVYAIGEDYIVASDTGRNHLSVRKADGVVIETYDGFYSIRGISGLPGSSRVFGRTSGISPSDIRYIQYSDDGKVIDDRDSPYHGDFAGASRTYAFPDGARVVDNSGNIYNTSDLSHNSTFGSSFTDIDFVEGDVPIILRDSELTAYTNTLVTTGSVSVPEGGLRVAVSGADALVFYPDGSQDSGLRADAFPLVDMNTATPGEPKNPIGLPFTPDEMFVDRDGILHLYSKAHFSLFRWSPETRTFIDAIPLSGPASYVAYSPVTHRVYTGYADGEIKQLELSAGVEAQETPFARTPDRIHGLATAGEFVFASDPSGAWNTHYTYTPEGVLISEVEWNRRSRQFEWSDANRKMYFFRDGTSPNDIHSEEIGTDGAIGAGGESPYHGTYSMIAPIRVSPDGSVLVLGSGRRYDGNSLATIGSFDGPIGDVTWLGTSAVTAETIEDGDTTRVMMWDTEYDPTNIIHVTGSPQRLFSITGDKILAVTDVAGIPAMTILDSQFGIEFGDAQGLAPEIVEQAASRRGEWGGSASLQVIATGTQPLIYEWSKNGEVIPDSNSRVLEFENLAFADAGDYSVRITNSGGEAVSESASLMVGRSSTPLFTPGNLLVSSQQQIHEYAPNGLLLQTIDIPHPDSDRYNTGDVVVDRFGRFLVYNNAPEDNSYISVYDPHTETWEHWLDPDMFLINISHADVALLGDTLYTNRSRFNILTGEQQPFPGTGELYSEISVGEDGKVYAIASNNRDIVELDPDTGAELRTIRLSDDIRGVTADKDGVLYVVEFTGEIRQYRQDGVLLASRDLDSFFYVDIDLAPDGRVAGGTHEGDIFVADSTFASKSEFNHPGDMAYVAWIPDHMTFDTEPDQTPVMEHEPFSYVINFQSSDPQGAIRITGELPAWLTLEDHGDGTATVSGTPMTDSDSGLNALAITARGAGGYSITQSFDLEIIAVNDAPIVAATTERSAPEDTPELRYDLNMIFSDEEDVDLDYVLDSPAGAAADGVLETITIEDNDLVLVPGADAFGLVSIPVRGTDSGGLVANTMFEIEITPVADRPTAEELPDLLASASGDDDTFAAAPYFADADPGDTMNFSITGNTNPEIFSAIWVDPVTGELHVEYADFVSGSATITLNAVDGTGLDVESELDVTLAAIDQPDLAVEDTVTLNRQTGLYEHRLVVTNSGERSIGGFTLWVSDLPATAQVYNATGQMEDGRWMVQHDAPVAAGASVEVLLEYYLRARGMNSMPVIEVEHALPLARVVSGDEPAAFAIDRIIPMADGAMLVEFPSEPGKSYLVQYSSDNQTWRDCLVPVRAGGTRVHWIDRGSPKTPTPPSEAGTRFYRIIEKQDAAE